MEPSKTSVGILGAGISGLSAAYALQKKGISSTVYEKSPQAGGAIRTYESNGWLAEEGPNTLMVKSELVWKLLAELKLDDKISEANSRAKKRFVVRDSQPVAMPVSVSSFLTSSLLSWKAKVRLLKEPFISASGRQDESIATFIKRRLGPEPLDYGVNPFVSGIYAGDPKKLSIKHTFPSLWEMEQKHDSLFQGMLKRRKRDTNTKRKLISFRKGLQTLPKRISRQLEQPLQNATEITSIEKEADYWNLKAVSDGESIETKHQCIISTVPTHALPGIFKLDLCDELSAIQYVPMSVLALGFKREDVDHPLDGFGMLMPEVENYNLLGVLFSSTLFEGRAPEGYELLTCFIGGARNPDLAALPKEELLSFIMPELQQLLGISGQPAFSHHKYWKNAIPQYNMGYKHFVKLMQDIEQQNKGLYLEGNFRAGVSVPDCIILAFNTAEKTAHYLQQLKR